MQLTNQYTYENYSTLKNLTVDINVDGFNERINANDYVNTLKFVGSNISLMRENDDAIIFYANEKLTIKNYFSPSYSSNYNITHIEINGKTQVFTDFVRKNLLKQEYKLMQDVIDSHIKIYMIDDKEMLVVSLQDIYQAFKEQKIFFDREEIIKIANLHNALILDHQEILGSYAKDGLFFIENIKTLKGDFGIDNYYLQDFNNKKIIDDGENNLFFLNHNLFNDITKIHRFDDRFILEFNNENLTIQSSYAYGDFEKLSFAGNDEFLISYQDLLYFQQVVLPELSNDFYYEVISEGKQWFDGSQITFLQASNISYEYAAVNTKNYDENSNLVDVILKTNYDILTISGVNLNDNLFHINNETLLEILSKTEVYENTLIAGEGGGTYFLSEEDGFITGKGSDFIIIRNRFDKTYNIIVEEFLGNDTVSVTGFNMHTINLLFAIDLKELKVEKQFDSLVFKDDMNNSFTLQGYFNNTYNVANFSFNGDDFSSVLDYFKSETKVVDIYQQQINNYQSYINDIYKQYDMDSESLMLEHTRRFEELISLNLTEEELMRESEMLDLEINERFMLLEQQLQKDIEEYYAMLDNNLYLESNEYLNNINYILNIKNISIYNHGYGDDFYESSQNFSKFNGESINYSVHDKFGNDTFAFDLLNNNYHYNVHDESGNDNYHFLNFDNTTSEFMINDKSGLNELMLLVPFADVKIDVQGGAWKLSYQNLETNTDLNITLSIIHRYEHIIDGEGNEGVHENKDGTKLIFADLILEQEEVNEALLESHVDSVYGNGFNGYYISADYINYYKELLEDINHSYTYI